MSGRGGGRRDRQGRGWRDALSALEALIAERDAAIIGQTSALNQRDEARARADTLAAELEAVWQDYRTADLGRRLNGDGMAAATARAEKARATLARRTAERDRAREHIHHPDWCPHHHDHTCGCGFDEAIADEPEVSR